MLFRRTKYAIGALIDDPDYDLPIDGGVVTDDEIVAVPSYIKSTWPRNILAFHDALDLERLR